MVDYYTDEEINYMDGGLFTLDNDELRHLMVKALVNVPSHIVDELMERCIVIMAGPNHPAFHAPNNLIGGKDIICLSDKLFKLKPEKAYFIILHEVAHCLLDHKYDSSLDLKERKRQETEADRLANKWLEKSTCVLSKKGL